MSNLYWFCQAVGFGGFAAASHHVGASAPTLSRAVSQLEQQVGEKLIHRNAKQFQLTTAGEEYYQRFAGLFMALQEQWGQRSNVQPTYSGDVHVSCPEPFADYFLQGLAIDFMAQHPQVRIYIHFASDTEHFFDEHIDLAIVTRATEAPHLVQKRLFSSETALAASPSYLASHGSPASVEELLNHDLLAGNTQQSWLFNQAGESIRIPLKPKYFVNSLRLSIQAACDGVGICLMPKDNLHALQSQGLLTQVLAEVECPAGVAYMVWADRKLIPARVAAFRDLIFDHLQAKTILSSIGD
ncbi:LysR family transcriptional regulator [Corallincola luteus]|nr:LysR family transcriptional regulator [Corallincola luteus]